MVEPLAIVPLRCGDEWRLERGPRGTVALRLWRRRWPGKTTEPTRSMVKLPPTVLFELGQAMLSASHQVGRSGILLPFRQAASDD